MVSKLHTPTLKCRKCCLLGVLNMDSNRFTGFAKTAHVEFVSDVPSLSTEVITS